ncbi:hypothetical protein SAMN05444161_8912 [Rhizobiales bacterium GAS191]|nr:hypothetical protein SAMN05444161_8912 [Rhizobiales bacterium GAS191]
MREAAIALGLALTLPAVAATNAQDASFGCKEAGPVFPTAHASCSSFLSGGWPGCPEAATSGGNIGYQPYQACSAGSVSVSAASVGSTYGIDPNGSACATAHDFQNYQMQLSVYNQAVSGQPGLPLQAPILPTIPRSTNSKPYYVDLDASGATTRLFFSVNGQ